MRKAHAFVLEHVRRKRRVLRDVQRRGRRAVAFRKLVLREPRGRDERLALGALHVDVVRTGRAVEIRARVVPVDQLEERRPERPHLVRADRKVVVHDGDERRRGPLPVAGRGMDELVEVVHPADIREVVVLGRRRIPEEVGEREAGRRRLAVALLRVHRGGGRARRVGRDLGDVEEVRHVHRAERVAPRVEVEVVPLGGPRGAGEQAHVVHDRRRQVAERLEAQHGDGLRDGRVAGIRVAGFRLVALGVRRHEHARLPPVVDAVAAVAVCAVRLVRVGAREYVRADRVVHAAHRLGDGGLDQVVVRHGTAERA